MRRFRWGAAAAVCVCAAIAASTARAAPPNLLGEPGDTGLTPLSQDPGTDNPVPGYHDNGRGGNTFVNDPCLDPPPTDPAPANRRRTVQSETEIATFGNDMVAGYNDSFGFYNNRQGLSGFAYSLNGGNTWVDGGGLPPVVKTGGPIGTPGQDLYEGDPVVVVDRSPRTFIVGGNPVSQDAGEFYFASIYMNSSGLPTLSVNRGRFDTAPPSTPESMSNTTCLNGTRPFGTPDTSNLPSMRIVWEPPVQAVAPVCHPIVGCDFLDKEWLYVSPANGELYLTYTRFTPDGETPLELVRSKDGGRTWEGPFTIVPNLVDTFNQATQTTQTSTGRLVVTWIARTFSAGGLGPESDNRIEVGLSDTDGSTWTNPIVVQHVNPQGEPNGYNRGRRSILNAPYIAPETNGTDVYITYFNGMTSLQGGAFTGPLAKAADIYVAHSSDNGVTWTPLKVNDDPGKTSHVFPSVQVNKNGDVFVGWLDRRNDPNNELTDLWANVSKDGGATYAHDVLQTDVATSWRVRADARPNFGDYNSSELLNDNQFVLIFADGRFPPPAPAPRAATPDAIFTIANGLGVGGG